MFTNTLETKTRSVFKLLSKVAIIKNFYLAGGTALALQFGHRESIDLDFFCLSNFSNEDIKKKLKKVGQIKVVSEDTGTLHVNINNVKVSFLYYPYKLVFKKQKFENINLADWQDISCMKLSAISNRGSKKDFIDLYYILQKIALQKLLDLFDKKYKKVKYNQQHILKSLIFFDDADKEPNPRMINKISWSEIKNKIKEILNKYLER